jgi:hypothetical protein
MYGTSKRLVIRVPWVELSILSPSVFLPVSTITRRIVTILQSDILSRSSCEDARIAMRGGSHGGEADLCAKEVIVKDFLHLDI